MLAFDNFAIEWFYILLLEHVMMISLYALAHFGFLSKSSKYRGSLLLATFIVLGSIRAIIVTPWSNFWGLENQGELWFFIVTGALFEVMMALFWANVSVPYREHKQLVAQVQKTQDALLGYRESAEEILQDENYRLETLAKESLVPQIQRIEKLMVESPVSIAARLNAVQEIKSMINNQVRPLSSDLRESAHQLANQLKPAPKPFMLAGLPPAKFAIANSIFPEANYVTMLLVFLATPNWTLGVQWIPLMLVASVSYWAILVAIKKSFSPTAYIPAWLGYPAMTLVSQLALVPTFALILIIAPNTRDALVFCGALALCSFVTFAAVAFFKSFEFQRARYIELLTQFNEELAYEAAVFEQKLWVARRSWSLTLHGTVQSSLTAALTRLSSSSSDARSRRAATKDLERALVALVSVQKPQLQLASAVRELAQTWRGVCEVDIEVDPAVLKLCKTNTDAAVCINEILKETVSNAVRHGEASALNAQIKLAPEGVRLEVSNDGQVPKMFNRKGLGSRLYDELTLSWNLQSVAETGLVIFTCLIPIADKEVGEA